MSFLAHELRNPLGSARTAARILRSPPFEVQGKIMDVLDRSLTKLHALIDETLVARRLQTGVTLHRERVDMRALLLDVEAESAVDAQIRGLALSTEVEQGLEVQGDARLLRSVITNLLRNAVKFSHPGGEIQLRGRHDGEYVVVGVEDSCGGLDPEKVSSLFDPFVQAHTNRSGFGLGLAIAKQAAEAHEGRIEVHNLPGKGCVFILSLPHGLR